MARLYAVLMLAASCAWGQSPAPIPFTADSRNPDGTGLTAYRANLIRYRVTFTDGTNASWRAGYEPYLAWYTNTLATSIATAAVTSVTSAWTNIVDFTFSPSDLNPSFSNGTYRYSVGYKTNGLYTTYRTGVFTLRGDPVAQGVSATTWTTNVNISLYTWSGVFPTSNIPWSFIGSGSGDLTAVNPGWGVAVTDGSGPIPTVALSNSVQESLGLANIAVQSNVLGSAAFTSTTNYATAAWSNAILPVLTAAQLSISTNAADARYAAIGANGRVTTVNSMTGGVTVLGGGIVAVTSNAAAGTVTVTGTEADTLETVLARGNGAGGNDITNVSSIRFGAGDTGMMDVNTINDANDQVSIAYRGRVLADTGGDTVLNWGTRELTGGVWTVSGGNLDMGGNSVTNIATLNYYDGTTALNLADGVQALNYADGNMAMNLVNGAETLHYNDGSTAIDMINKTMEDGGGEVSINPVGRILYADDGATEILNWSTGDAALNYADGNMAMNLVNGAETLNYDDGSTALDLVNKTLVTSITLGDQLLSPDNSAYLGLADGTPGLFNTDGVVALDILASQQSLHYAAGNTAFNLIDADASVNYSDGTVALDLSDDDSKLKYTDASTAIDLENKTIEDGAGFVSINPVGRVLYADDGTTEILNWSTAGAALNYADGTTAIDLVSKTHYADAVVLGSGTPTNVLTGTAAGLTYNGAMITSPASSFNVTNTMARARYPIAVVLPTNVQTNFTFTIEFDPFGLIDTLGNFTCPTTGVYEATGVCGTTGAVSALYVDMTLQLDGVDQQPTSDYASGTIGDRAQTVFPPWIFATTNGTTARFVTRSSSGSRGVDPPRTFVTFRLLETIP